MDQVAQWRNAFLKELQRSENATQLKDAALESRLGVWTKLLTDLVVASFRSMGWQASAKGNKLQLLPVSRSEYLSLDIVAFSSGTTRWRFPVAIAELENSADDDKVAYSLWKVMCVRNVIRIVFCYRADADKGSKLVHHLRDEVLHAMSLESRIQIDGQTLVVVGQKGEADTFPYSYFNWWLLEPNTSKFEHI